MSDPSRIFAEHPVVSRTRSARDSAIEEGRGAGLARRRGSSFARGARTGPTRPLQMALMHDQLKPDCLTRRNNDSLRLTADTLYGIAASGHVEDGVSKIIR
jgi:hypothetical protein